MNYRAERRKSPANFSFGRPSIFHRVTFLLAPPPRLVRPQVARSRNDKLYRVYTLRIERASEFSSILRAVLLEATFPSSPSPLPNPPDT